MKEGSSTSEHIVKLVGYVDRLASVEFGIPPTLGTDIVLASLPPSYDGFIMNYNMNGMEKVQISCLLCSKLRKLECRRTIQC
jgi:hypothetical protein